MNFEVLKRSHVKRNILISVVVVLVLSTIILTFTRAKYKTTESMPLVNGTINYELSDFNLIEAYIQEGDSYTQVNKIPTSGYEFNAEKSYCTVNNENINATLNYDMEMQNLTITPLTTKGTKCYLYFDEASSASDVIEDAYEENQDMLAYDGTVGNNLRYIGADPNNYVYFNCDDYNNPSNSTCELWRIIGVFSEDSHGISNTKLVKLIRASSIGSMAWDSDPYGYNWATASLQTNLNGTYLNGTTLGSGKGVTKATRNMIAEVTWKIGSIGNFDSTASMFYESERGTVVPSGALPTWLGKIALMYPSDYGYATSGGSTSNRTSCLNRGLRYWSDTNYSYCKNNDWLYDSSADQWTLNIYPYRDGAAYNVNSTGYVYINDYVSYTRTVRPSIYLSSNVTISGGDGTINNPYTLKV